MDVTQFLATWDLGLPTCCFWNRNCLNTNNHLIRITWWQCNGSGMIYSGSGSEFSEFRICIRIQAQVPDLCESGSESNPCYLITGIFGICKQNHLKFNHKEESINYLPFSISYYSPTVHKVQNSKRNNIFLYLLFHILLDPDPGKSSESMRIRIHNTAWWPSSPPCWSQGC